MVSIAIGDYLENILSWIKLQWKDAIPLKRVYIVVASIIGFALFILFCILYSQLFLVPLGLSTLELSDIDSGFALAFLGTVTGGVALFSGFLAILRSEENKRENDVAEKQSKTAIRQSQIALRQSQIYNEQSKTANRQAITAEEGLITDRINKATEGLGKFNVTGDPIVEVRLGALYALERIAQDSIRDHVQIMEIICAYIRHNSQWSNKPSQVQNRHDKEKEDEQKDTKNEKFETDEPREDIQAALTIIGRRKGWPEGAQRLEIEKQQLYSINLNHCDLHKVRIEGANLCGASFIDSNLTNATIIDTDMTKARICMTDLTNVLFDNVEMKDIDTIGSFAYNGDFLRCKNFIQEQIDIMFLGEDVKLKPPLKNFQKKYDTFYDFTDGYFAWFKIIAS